MRVCGAGPGLGGMGWAGVGWNPSDNPEWHEPGSFFFLPGSRAAPNAPAEAVASTHGVARPPTNHPHPHPRAPTSLALVRRELNRLDNAKSARATDAMLNYETVKIFTNEGLERANFERVRVGG